jgi:hypothetical protein
MLEAALVVDLSGGPLRHTLDLKLVRVNGAGEVFGKACPRQPRRPNLVETPDLPRFDRLIELV